MGCLRPQSDLRVRPADWWRQFQLELRLLGKLRRRLMTPAGLGDRVHFIYHDYRHTISIYVVRNKKEKGCLPVVYLLDILVVFSVSHPDMNMIVYRTG